MIADANGQLANYPVEEEHQSHHHISGSKVIPVTDIKGNVAHYPKEEEHQSHHHD
jgi:CRISPR/Cas system CMR subunit Cmr6 (Cas7 group RAMP superfamily)